MSTGTIIDMHMHLFPRFNGTMQSRTYGKVQLQDGSLFKAVPPSFVNTDSPPEVALAYMDWCGVDKALLLQGGLHGPQNASYIDIVQRSAGTSARPTGRRTLSPALSRP